MANFIKTLRVQGYSTDAILDFLCDGEALLALGFTNQTEAENAYTMVKVGEL